MSARWFWVLGFAVASSACRSKESQEAEPAPPPKVSALSVQGKPLKEPMVVEPPEVPTEADFEEDAAREITSKNLEAALDALERELKAP